MQIQQAGRCRHRRSKRHLCTSRGIKNPRGGQHRDTGIALQHHITPIATTKRAKDFHLIAEIRVPTVVDPANLSDMGRMNGNWA